LAAMLPLVAADRQEAQQDPTPHHDNN